VITNYKATSKSAKFIDEHAFFHSKQTCAASCTTCVQ
jgi:hypothetical protein